MVAGTGCQPLPWVPPARCSLYRGGMDLRRPRRNPIVSVALAGALRGYLALRTIGWFVTRPQTRGVRAIAVTDAGAVILVRHSYLPGWHLPGGGQERGESAEAALLRELREEIGMVAHGRVRLLGELAHRPNYRHDTVTLAVVEDVRFAFRPSLEITDAAAFDPEALPPDTTAATRRRIAEWREARPPAPDW